MDITKEEGAHWTREKHLESIRRACVEAQSEKRWDTEFVRRPNGENGYYDREIIRLADVLVIFKTPMHGYARYQKVVEALCGRSQWNMYKDDLTEQSDECLAFISGLLANGGDTV